uniref:RRM domain-containing protein n=1 Tax=Hymenolepis diminuta TaxID=6216 RepID=A0A0R3SVU0_HYMDI
LGFYDAVKCGSIDAVVDEDIPPHDRAVCRAQAAKYRPSEASFPERDFKLWSEEKVEEMGKVSIIRNRSPEQHKSRTKDSLWPLVRVVKHPITGESRGYAFAWFKSPRDANRVLESWRCSSNFFKPSGCSEGVRVDLRSIFVDMLGFEQMILEPCFGRTLPGWKPRRLGGGLGGFKESGQLRFGGIARPFRQPLRRISP